MTRPAPSTPAPSATLPGATRMGAVELTVRDLARSLAFYERSLGLRVHRRELASAALGAGGEDLLVLAELPAARPAGRHAGLYHVALLHPSRAELSRAAVRLAATRTPIQGASDHGTHEAIYLPDPDGNGLELAADRPREQWPDLGRYLYAGGPQPLDLDALLALTAHEAAPPHAAPGLGVGHMHLHVGDLPTALAFYRDVVGFQVMSLLPSAGFVSAGGYHHHVAVNTWRGEGVGPAPSDAVGLRHFTVLVPSAGDLEALRARLAASGVRYDDRADGLLARDPAGNALVLAVDPAR